eukprot:scaffold21278_cov62-Cyclotella_meneghiniana.AAC.3
MYKIHIHIDDFDAALTERLDDANFRLPNDEGDFKIDDAYDMPPWDTLTGTMTRLWRNMDRKTIQSLMLMRSLMIFLTSSLAQSSSLMTRPTEVDDLPP